MQELPYKQDKTDSGENVKDSAEGCGPGRRATRTYRAIKIWHLAIEECYDVGQPV